MKNIKSISMMATTVGVFLGVCSADNATQQKAPELLIVKVVKSFTASEKHGNIRVIAFLKVVRVDRTATNVRVGQMLFIETMHQKDSPQPWPLPVMKLNRRYRAFLIRQIPAWPKTAKTAGSVTSVQGADIYRPAAGGASFTQLPLNPRKSRE